MRPIFIIGSVPGLLLLFGSITPTHAGIGFPFGCKSVGCSFCSTQRMKQVCSSFCNSNCVSDFDAVGGYAEKPTYIRTPRPTRRTAAPRRTTPAPEWDNRRYRPKPTTPYVPPRIARTRPRFRPTPAPVPRTRAPRPRPPPQRRRKTTPPPVKPRPRYAPTPEPRRYKRPPTTPPYRRPTPAPRRRQRPERPERPKSNERRRKESSESREKYRRPTTDRQQKRRKSSKDLEESRLTCPKPDWTPCVPRAKADERFLKCCKSEGLPPGCHEVCKYGVDRATLENIFMWKRSCAPQMIPLYLYCASGGEDAKPCCKAKGLINGPLEVCSPFCHPAGGMPAFNLAHVQCLQKMDQITSCYQAMLKPLKRNRRTRAGRRRTRRNRRRRTRRQQQ